MAQLVDRGGGVDARGHGRLALAVLGSWLIMTVCLLRDWIQLLLVQAAIMLQPGNTGLFLG